MGSYQAIALAMAHIAHLTETPLGAEVRGCRSA